MKKIFYERIHKLSNLLKNRKMLAAIFMALIVVVISVSVSVQPVSTMTKEYLELSVDLTNVDFGDTIPLTVSAMGTDAASCFNLTFFGDGAGLSDEYIFEDDRINISDNNGNTIELNREIGGDGAVNYYFYLGSGETAEFVLNCVSGVFVNTETEEDYYAKFTYIDEDGNEFVPSDEEIAAIMQAELEAKIEELEAAVLSVTPGFASDFSAAKLDTINHDAVNLRWDRSSTQDNNSSDSGIMLFSASKMEVVDSGAITNPTTGEDTGLTWTYTKDTLTGEGTLTISGEGAIPDNCNPGSAYASNIKNIIIGDGVTSIGKQCFMNTFSALTNLTIGSGVTYIGRESFSLCSLSSLYIPGNVKTIDTWAFQYCTSLKSVTLAEGVESINSAFRGCSSLSSFHLPSTLNSFSIIDAKLTEYTVAEGNATFYAVDGVLFKYLDDGTSELVSYPPQKADYDEYIIPDFVSTIGAHAFYNQKYLRKVTVPATVTKTINSTYMFYSAAALEEVVFEEGVSIGNSTYAFQKCTNLKRVILPDDSFSNTSYFRFTECSSLEELYIPSGVNSIFSSAVENHNLQRVYYNIKGSSVTAFNVNNGISAVETANKYEVTIGNGVDRIYNTAWIAWGTGKFTFKETILLNAGSVLFEGENQLTIDEGVFEDMPAPLNGLSGTVWVDNQGVVYKYDKSSLTASVAYVPYGLTSVTIPGTITPEDGVTCIVNSVDSYAFKLAENLKTLTFDNPDAIESIATYGMAYCSNLSEVNGATTVEEAAALFTNDNISIGYRPFYNTALGSLSGDNADLGYIDGEKELEITAANIQPMYISIYDDGTLWTSDSDIGRYNTLTGKVLSVNMSVGSTDIENTMVYRVYFETSGLDASISISPGDILSINGTDMTCYATEAPNIMYIEFIPSVGTTVTQAVEISYPSPSSGGGNLKVWGMILSPEEAVENQGKIIECETVGPTEESVGYTKALQAYWGTQPDDFSVSKTSSGNTAIALTGDGNGGVTAGSNLGYQIVYSRIASETTVYGSDYVKTADFYDCIDFDSCEGIEWREEVLEAVKNGNTRYAGGIFYAGDIAIAKVSNTASSAALIGGSVEYDEEKGIILHWKIYNSKTDAEIAATTTALTIYKEALSFDAMLLNDEPGSLYEFTNNVESVTHYSYSEEQTSTSSAVKYFSLSAGTITLSKSAVNNGYMGGTINYTIGLYNTSAMTFWGDEGVVYTVKDNLNTYLYIKPDDMERMFGDEYGENLTITITNAVLSDWSEVTDVFGETAYVNAVNSDIASSTDTLTISWNSERTALQVRLSDGTVYEVGSSLKETLMQIGYSVSQTTAYTTVWNLNDDDTRFSFTGGEYNYFYIYSTVKDTFQMLAADYPGNYSTASLTISNYASLYKSTSSSAFQTRGVSNNVKREAYLYKNASLHTTGEQVSDNNVQLGDVIDYSLELDHYGKGSYENLPMVDEMYGTQVLLVPADENQSLGDKGLETYVMSENGVDVIYYKLSEPGIYKSVVVGIDESGNYLIADTVTVTEADEYSSIMAGSDLQVYTGLYTKINWYFSQTESGIFYNEIKYHALADEDLLNSSAYTIGNIAWVNDKAKDRIYSGILGGGSLINYDKEIVTRNDDGTYTADADDYTVIGDGDNVTYRLTFSNPNSYTFKLEGSSFYDALPVTYGVFDWEKDVNVSVYWEDTDSADVLNLDNWSVVDEIDGIVQEGVYYIKWSDDAVISVAPGEKFCVYVTLTYPSDSEDDENYSSYCEAVSGDRIDNSLYVYGSPAVVYHSLKDKGSALLQKGVYATYRYNGNTYSQTSSRIYYNNADSTGRAVMYYVVLYNDGNSRLYLQDIYDSLPQGFAFLRMSAGTTISGSSVSAITTSTSNSFTSVTSSNSDEAVSYKAATVTASSSDGILSFNVSGSTGANAVKYDEFEEKYYLDRGEAIVFGYICGIGDSAATQDNAVNVIGMEYYDYLDAGIKLVSQDEVSVRGKTTELYEEQNDGQRALKYTEDISGKYGFAAESNDSSLWLLSDVSIRRGEIIPGVTCYTDSYVNSGSSIVETYKTSVSPFATVNWRARLHNSGTNAITNYTFTDVLPSPYGLVGTVSMSMYDSTSAAAVKSYNILNVSERNDANGYITVQSPYDNISYKLYLDGTPITVNIAAGVTVNVSLTRDENGQETLQIDFENSVFSIPENGGYVDVTLSSRNVTGVYNNTVYTNYAYMTPKVQEYDSAAQGSLVYDEGNIAGVVSASSVNVSIGYSTSSLKMVEEIENNQNVTDSNADKKYILLDNKESLFRYTLAITNDTQLSMTKLVLIDSLPQEGDHSPFDKNAGRMSEFTVSLADNPEFTVTIFPVSGESYVLAPEFYTIGYSSAQEFTSDDWSGLSDWDEWTQDAENVRSIRLYISDDDGLQIPVGARIEFSFNAKVDDQNASAGMTAWNSFGYHYGLAGVGYELEAMPLPVGVKIPEVPVLRKKLIDLTGNEYKTLETETFSFVLYSGNEISGDYGSIDELVYALESENRSYRQIELSVEEGRSASEMLKLEFDDWAWSEGESYTLVEISDKEYYKLDGWNNSSAQSVTFTYNPDAGTTLSCTNIWQKWSVDILKVDGDDNGTVLAGAVFALYSAQADDLISDEAYSTLTCKPDKTVDDSDGTIWYLCDVSTTDENGSAEFDNLYGENYYLAEVKSPDGYKLDWKPRIIDSSFMSEELLVENYTMTKLPYTGGSPGSMSIIAGFLLVAISISAIIYKLRKN